MSFRTKKIKRFMLILSIVLLLLAALVVGYLSHPKFGRAPRGERLERMQKSPDFRDGMFHNRIPTPQITSDKGMAKAMFDFLFEKRERNRPEAALPAVKTDLKNLDPQAELLVWFGHSSYFIQSGGKRILIDPVFADASPVSFVNKPFCGTDLYTADDMPDIDYLIITHDHWDHLDYATVTRLRERTGRVVCPLGVGEYFEQWGFDTNRLVELGWDESAPLESGFTVHCLPTRHFSGRTFKRNRTLWASFLLETPSRTLYIGGDGGYDSRFADLAQRFPQVDLALLENGQYDNDWRYIHLMPADVVRAIRELNPRAVLTGHNSKYALARHPWDEPMNLVSEAAAKDSFNLLTPRIGEPVLLDEMPKPAVRWWNTAEND